MSQFAAFLSLCSIAIFCEWVSRFLPIALPGPLLGLLVLFIALLFMRRVPVGLQQVTHFLLKHMSLFFIPALVSVSLFADELTGKVWILGVALVVSTSVSLWLTAFISHKVLK